MLPGRILFLVVTAAAALGGQPPGAVYYVATDGNDRNPGTADQPWRRLEWAMTRPTLRPGDTIRVRRGVYRPVVEAAPSRDSLTDDTLIRPVASGEPGRPITVMGEPGEAVVLSGRVVATAWEAASGAAPVYFHDYSLPSIYPFEPPFQVTEDGKLLYRAASLEAVDRPGRCFVDPAARRIWVWASDGAPPETHLMEYGASVSGLEFRSGVKHWRVAGLAITGFRTTGVRIETRAGGIELDRVDISYIGAHRPGADLSSGHAVAVYETSGGNWIHDSRLGRTLAEAVHISQTGAGGDLWENNEIHHAGGAEWRLEGSSSRTLFGPGLILRGGRVTLRGNRLVSNGYHGLILESDLRGSEGASAPGQNIIEGNVFAFNGGNGVYGDGKNGATASAGNVLRFNLFDRNNQARGGSSGDAELRLAGNFDDTVVAHNTFYSEQANGVLLLAGRVGAGTSQGADAIPERTRLINNIAVHAGRFRETWPLRVLDGAPGLAADANNWYRPAPGPLVSWNGTEFPTLAEFSARTGLERRGLSVDPRFVSLEAGHFWLRALSPVIGRGLAEQPGPQPDLGAFPYRPLLAVTPAELRFAAVAGGRSPAAQSIQIRSAAEIPLAWTVRTAGERWVALSAAVGETPGAARVAIDLAALAPGVHSGTIQVTPAIEGEPPLAVRVVVTVAPNPPRRRQ